MGWERAERTMESIEETVREMDEKYDANFGEWVRNEENLKVVATNFKKYIEEYSEETVVEVIKWVVKNWKLKSICTLLKELVLSDLFHELDALNADMGFKTDLRQKALLKQRKAEVLGRIQRKIRIVNGLIENWGCAHISEFIVSALPDLKKEEKKAFLLHLLKEFDHQKLTEVFVKIDSAIDWALKISIIKSNRSAARCAGAIDEESSTGSPLLKANI